MTPSLRLRWKDIASFNVERGWYHQYVAVRPVRGDRMVLPAPRTAWYGQQARFNADLDRLAAASAAHGGPTVHRRVGNSRTRGLVLVAALAFLLLFERPWYWVRFSEYAAPADACAVLAAARPDTVPGQEGHPFTVDYRPGWAAKGCDAADGATLRLFVAQRHGLMSGAGVAASELRSMSNRQTKSQRDLTPDGVDAVVDQWPTGYGVTMRVGNVLIRVGPTGTVDASVALAVTVAEHL